MKKQIKRLEEIGESLSRTDHALALLGLGSVGVERERIDQFSDLDFFVICEEGYKSRYIEQLDWLENIHPIIFSFKNTPDGYKVLYEDHLFCEFAIFEPGELKNISFSEGKIIWKRTDFNDAICQPNAPKKKPVDDVDFLINEALTNLYIGLGRYFRGEKLSAYNFIQQYAFNRILHLIRAIEEPINNNEDLFDLSRRFEERYPIEKEIIPNLLLGYNHTIESAKNCLRFLDQHFMVNEGIKQKILSLIEKGDSNE